MHPLIVVDVETTGLPGKTPPDLLRIVEVGAVFVDPYGDVRRSFGELVNPGDAIVESKLVQPALEISGLTPATLIDRGRETAHVARDFVCWVQSLPWPLRHLKVTAYNRDFDMGFLDEGPWKLALYDIERAPCLMLESLKVMVEHGAATQKPWMKGTPPPALELLESGSEGEWFKWPRSEEAIEWLRERGHYIPELRGHRAMDDAIMEAWVAVALGKEDQS